MTSSMSRKRANPCANRPAAVAGSVAFLLTQSFNEWVPFLVGVAVVLIIRLGAVLTGWQVPTLATPTPDTPKT